MIEGERTLLLRRWTSGINAVSVGEILSFCDYAGMTLREAIRRLRSVDIEVDPTMP